jgi:hypothetical protein
MSFPSDDGAMSRHMSVGGKQTQAVKTLVSDEFKDELTKFWRQQGYQSESDFIRELLIVTVHGPDYLTDLHAQRIRSLVRNTAGVGTERDR